MRTIRMRFLVPSVDGAAVLLDAAGGLPTIDVDVESTAMSGTAAAARHFGLEPPVLDCFVDQTSEEQLAGAIREALIVMPGSSAAPSSPDLRWAAMDDARPRCAAGLQPVCDARPTGVHARVGCQSGTYAQKVHWAFGVPTLV